MKNKYLGGTFLLILIYCGVIQHRNDMNESETQQSKLIEIKANFVDLKHKKQDKTGIVPDSAMTSIYSSIAAKEYNVTKDPVTGIPQSPNRNQNLRAYFKPGTFTLKNRVDSVGHNFKLTLTTEGVYADSEKLLISHQDTATIISENKIQLKQGILTEEYINSEAGVRQNFIVQQAPKGTKELQVKLSAKGLKVKDLSGNRLQFYAGSILKDAKEKLTYDGLKCWDANGKILPATLSYKDGLVQIAVNTASAVYPVTIDPIVINGTPANANALLESKQAGARFGYSVASAGDVNGDGYSDVLVGAPNYDAAKPNQGAFFLYLGSSTGIDASKGTLHKGDNFIENNNFGNSVSGAGDVNGDGYSDVIVGSYAYSKGQTVDGAIYIYYGSAAGLNLSSVKIESKQVDAQLGFSTASAGDVNGDGYSDIIVGAPTFSHGEAYEGAAFIFMGSATGISITASDTLEANQNNSFYGHSVASAGDVNGDGLSDVVVGAYNYDGVSQNEGAAFVYLGSQSGVLSAPHATLHGEHTNSGFGISVSTAGDINADGYSDLIVGSPAYTNAQGKAEGGVFVYLASSQGAGIQNQSKFIVGGQYGSAFGATVACAGDINGDGFSDVIVGEPDRDNAGVFNQGWAYVYFGSVNGSLKSVSFISAGQTSAYVGYSVASAGDVNGDGFSDIIVGAPDYDKSAIDEGLALVYHGSPASVETNFSVQIMTNQTDAEMGFSVSGAGDVNGDGYDDVIVGAPFYDNGANNEGVAFVYLSDGNGVDLSTGVLISRGQAEAQFGYSMGAAGDVNADGYDDIIIGANLYDMDGVPDCGAGFVYYGSPAGLSLANATAVYLPKWGAHGGASVNGAGDLNADGYDDVIIGVPSHDGDLQSNEGAFVVSYGSKSGIKSGGGTVIKGNQAGAELGNSLASAGDINGDGYDDVVVGSHKFSGNVNTPEEGAAFVYYGGLYGIGTSGTILDLNNSKALLGWDVAGAGDINGDGFADVIVGAKNYSKGELNEGAVAIFYGSLAGIKAYTPTILEGNQIDALMGSSVSSADVNGDGYTDIIVGATAYTDDQGKEGAVLIYHGSETGIIASVAALIGGNQIFSQMGYSVSFAGDVNGDGFEDLIVGANKFSGTGRAFMYHGNGDGISVNNDRAVRGNIHLYNSDLSSNISADNLGKDDFGLGIYAKSFLGRNKGKLVWEIVGQGESFSHASPITNSTQFTGQGNLTDLQTTATELKSLVTKNDFLNKVRARVRFSPVLAITGQVYGPWRYESSSILADPSVLPVELIWFDAKAVEKQVDITWETATEVNSDYFELQRSEDGKKWEQIGTVYSAGDSKKPNAYNFVDFKPQIGLNYYRLKMVDRDNTFAYSSIKAVMFAGKETRVFPNPVLTTLNIDSENANTEVVIYDVSGKEVMSHKNEKGINSVDVSRLIPGSYLVKLGNKSFHIIKK